MQECNYQLRLQTEQEAADHKLYLKIFGTEAKTRDFWLRFIQLDT